MRSSPSIAMSIGIGILIFLLLLSIVGIFFLRRYLKTLHNSKPPRKLKTAITPKEPPDFAIPPYKLLTEKNDARAETRTVSENDETKTDEGEGKLSRPAFRRAFTMPPSSDLLRTKKGLSCEKGGAATGLSTKEYKPQYRRAVFQFAPNSAQAKREPTRNKSLAPYGKLEVSLQFVTTKNLLIVQVNGAFDLPHVHLSGISTPYVRVHLLPGQRHKDSRSNFLNLGTNRICMFDQITLQEAQSSTLKFFVLDYDKFSRSEFVAEVMLSLLDVDITEGTTLSLHLNSKTIADSHDRGSLTLSLWQKSTSGHLHVIIMKATGLPPPKSDAPGGLDTYVKVLYSVQGKVIGRKKTKVVKKSTSPVFNEAFVFDIREEELNRSSIMCEVCRGDTVLKTERIGYITLGLESFGTEVRHWNDMMMSPLKRITETHLLHA